MIIDVFLCCLLLHAAVPPAPYLIRVTFSNDFQDDGDVYMTRSSLRLELLCQIFNDNTTDRLLLSDLWIFMISFSAVESPAYHRLTLPFLKENTSLTTISLSVNTSRSPFHCTGALHKEWNTNWQASFANCLLSLFGFAAMSQNWKLRLNLNTSSRNSR